jgi:hypothetical protein
MFLKKHLLNLYLIGIATVTVGIAVGHSANAAVPQYFNYQGKLSDPTTGLPKPDGNYQFIFRIVDDSGAVKGEYPVDVNTTNGLFNAKVGPVEPSIFDNPDLWLEIEVNGETFGTLQKILSVAYALKAGNADALRGGAVTVDDAGNVGVGTTNPGAKLELAGLGTNDGLYFNGNTKVKITTTTDTGTDSLMFAGQTSKNAALYIVPGGNEKFSALSLSSGPSQTTGAYLIHDGRSGELVTRLQLLGATHDRFSILNDAANEIFRVRANGNVGISANAEVKLEIHGNEDFTGIRIRNNRYHTSVPQVGIEFQHWPHALVGRAGKILSLRLGAYNETAASHASALAFYTANNDIDTEWMRITNTGNVGIGRTEPQYKLDVNGTIRGTTVIPSDARLKTDIAPLNAPLDRVTQLRGVNYRWVDEQKGNKLQMGVIAQEVEGIFPEVVYTDDLGEKSVAYGKLVPALIEAIKAQQAQLQHQAEEIEALKTQNSQLRQTQAEVELLKAQMAEIQAALQKQGDRFPTAR